MNCSINHATFPSINHATFPTTNSFEVDDNSNWQMISYLFSNTTVHKERRMKLLSSPQTPQTQQDSSSSKAKPRSYKLMRRWETKNSRCGFFSSSQSRIRRRRRSVRSSTVLSHNFVAHSPKFGRALPCRLCALPCSFVRVLWESAWEKQASKRLFVPQCFTRFTT